MSILGNRVLRTEDPKFLRGGATFMADLCDPIFDGAAYVTFVRSTMAHATFTIDTEEALAAHGVVAVYTGADLDVGPLPPPFPGINPGMARPLLATDRVRFVGEPVAAIVTERPEQGPDTTELVYVDYGPLPVVTDPETASGDEILLFPDAETNCAVELDFGRADDLFADCEVVVRRRLVQNRLASCPLEVRGGAAVWTGDFDHDGDSSHLTLFLSSQSVHGVRDTLAQLYGLDASQVRVVAPDVGGGFGPKIGAHAEELLLPWIARRVRWPVRWHETRSENMVGMNHGRAQVQLIEMGGRRDGTVEAYRLSILQDGGAYPAMGVVLPYMTRMMAAGPYAIPKIECNTSSVVTNTTPTAAYRGAGRPEATAAIERAMDLFAAEIGLDPAAVRRFNLMPAFDEPTATAIGTTYDCGDFEEALDRVLQAAGYGDLRIEQRRRRDAGERQLLGVGVCVYVEVTAGPMAGEEHAAIEIHRDGTATVYTGTSPHGQGHGTSFAMIASDQTGIPLDDVKVVWGDTDVVAKGQGTMGSRSLQLGGAAVVRASEVVVDQARKLAAELLEASPDDVVLDRAHGRFHVAGTPAIEKSWSDVAGAAGPDGLSAATDFEASSPTFPFGAHVAVVEVDAETGVVRVLRVVTVDDAGRVLNPLLAEGQRHGGIAQGVAQALYEEVAYDASGNPQSANLADYAMISATELPSFELVAMETPTPVNPLGAKGIGESGTIGSAPAVQSAVCDALAHLGVRHIDMPCTPEKVWRAIEEAHS